MSQTRRPLNFPNPMRVTGVSNKSFPREFGYFPALTSSPLAWLAYRETMAVKLLLNLSWHNSSDKQRNVREPCCQTTVYGLLKMWIRVKRGFLQHRQHYSRGGKRKRAGIWIHDWRKIMDFKPWQSISCENACVADCLIFSVHVYT